MKNDYKKSNELSGAAARTGDLRKKQDYKQVKYRVRRI